MRAKWRRDFRPFIADQEKSDLGGFPPAKTRRPYRHLRAGGCEIQPRLDQRRFDRLAAARQTFVQAVQAPHVFGVPAGAVGLAVEAEVGAVDRFRSR